MEIEVFQFEVEKGTVIPHLLEPHQPEFEKDPSDQLGIGT